ncbi:carbonic anhydrase [Pseudacidobacterium ailaaui]|jgi:carbonic anhydrase|uniref:carbonic anhydrase n=1 Tax=Pseudacidobacterium ailaaui TaxID=1382359 RepID=UPI0005D2C7A1|nr:carbonic anhydrase [Pseudacidobacterium ailaaui]MDI3254304.1 carbonic anhydrase [Bacillota bacterium]
MEKLIAGYKKFRSEVYPEKQDLFQQLAQSQNPQALFLTCSDSRIVPDLVLQTGPGDLFHCRDVGNIVPPYGEMPGGVSATIEYAVSVLKVRHFIICGHSDCGAMKGLLNHRSLDSLPNAASWLRFSRPALETIEKTLGPEASYDQRLQTLIRANVVRQMEHARTHPSVAAALASGQLLLHGWTYDIPHGIVEAFHPESSQFLSLDQMPLPVHAK